MSEQPKTCQCKVCGATCKVLKNGKPARHGYKQRGRCNSGNGCIGDIFLADAGHEVIAAWADKVAARWDKDATQPQWAAIAPVKAAEYRSLAADMRAAAQKVGA